MKIGKRFLISIVLMLGLNSGKGFGQMLDISKRPDEGLANQEYIYAFTEATRYYLFGNYVQAVNLYNECLKLRPESGAVHFQLAKIFLNSGNTVLAREHAKKAYFFDQKNKWYSQQLADVFQIEEKFDSAAVIYENMLRSDPDNLNIMYGIASLYEKKGKYNDALKYLDSIDGRVGISKEVAINRYRVLESMGNSSKALEQLKIAHNLSGEEYTITGMIAEFFRRHSMVDSAKAYYNKISHEYMIDPMVVFSHADFLLEIGEYDSAQSMIIRVLKNEKIENMAKAGYFFRILRDEKAFENAKPIIDSISKVYYLSNRSDVRALSVYADVQLRLREFRNASIALRKIVDQDESNYPAIEQLIYTLNILGKSDSVLLYSDRAIQKFKESAILYLLNGSARFQKKEYERALQVLEKGLSMTNEKSVKIEFYSLIAECYQQLGKYDLSEGAFNQALQIDKNNILIKNNYAYYLSLREKNLKFARKISFETIKAEPENSTYLDTYAWVLFKMGKVRAAKKVVMKALNYGGNENEEILSHTAEILLKLKEYSEAVKYLKRVLLITNGKEVEEIKSRISDIERRF